MSRFLAARWSPSDRPALFFTGGPPKIVHHTTEGTSIAGAEAAYGAKGSWPHFTVSADEIVQHIDTRYAARALRNESGGVQTNTDTCYQIEVVGYAAKPKLMRTLANVARVCRWLEAEHGVPAVWPNGFPKVAVDGRDPGDHNRNAENWATRSGHYGHCHVPENTHWDPGYTPDEVRQIMPLPEPIIIVPPKEEDMAKPYIAWNPGNSFLVENNTKVFIGGALDAVRAAGRKLYPPEGYVEVVLPEEFVSRIPDAT